MDHRDSKDPDCKLTSIYLQAFYDIYHLFERSDKVILDGKELDSSLKEHGIHLTDAEIDETLDILNNHDELTDINEFCYLLTATTNYLAKIRPEIKQDKRILSALKDFMRKSAASCIVKRESWGRKSADTIGFYFEVARLSGLTERQVAIRACSIDTTGSSPYRQSIVLPGLPPDDNAKGTSLAVSQAPCTVIPPPTNVVSGKRLSRCTILPFTGSKSCKPPLSVTKPARKYIPPPYITNPDGSLVVSSKEKKQVALLTVQSSEERKKELKKSQPQLNEVKDAMEQEKKKPKNKLGRPLPFKLPEFPNYEGKKITFEEMSKVRDEILLARVKHRKQMREIAAKRIVDSLPSDSFRKQFRNTVKAYFGC